VFTCVGWQVTLCDPIWQVTSRSSEMGFPWRAISAFTFKSDCSVQNNKSLCGHCTNERRQTSRPWMFDVRRIGPTRLSTVGDRVFPVAAARLWNSLPSHVTAAPSLSVFCCRLKSHLFSLSYPAFWVFSHSCSDLLLL